MSASKNLANDYIPKDYDDLYRYYIRGDGKGNSLCCQIIRSMMEFATAEELETLPGDVFERLMAKKQLENFDATKANFGGVIFYVTRTIVCNHLDRKSRNPMTGLKGGSLVETDPEDGIFEPGTYSLERLFGGATIDTGAKMDAKSLVTSLFAWAKQLADKPRHTRDRNLFPLLNLLAQEYNPKECGEELGVTASTIHNWLLIIKEKATELRQLAA